MYVQHTANGQRWYVNVTQCPVTLSARHSALVSARLFPRITADGSIVSGSTTGKVLYITKRPLRRPVGLSHTIDYAKLIERLRMQQRKLGLLHGMLANTTQWNKFLVPLSCDIVSSVL